MDAHGNLLGYFRVRGGLAEDVLTVSQDRMLDLQLPVRYMSSA